MNCQRKRPRRAAGALCALDTNIARVVLLFYANRARAPFASLCVGVG